ncbi:hypothetical protein LWI29_023995 [Acer saccharum]|uniref:Uncharacterized protein n=1 Tax=Acer saccharum TaxID=4024 RepID=A0AA39RXQ3_ACESA|nr:hypothetical protein LWI29_023995 [Acer saccharum]
MTKDGHIVVCDSTTGFILASQPIHSKESSVISKWWQFGDSNPIQKVNLLKPCCWTTTVKKNEKECGLVVLYRTDLIEIRSFPNLEVVNGCAFAFISLLAYENDLRIPESLPCLHNKVIAAAAEATINLSLSQKKVEDTAPGIWWYR